MSGRGRKLRAAMLSAAVAGVVSAFGASAEAQTWTNGAGDSLWTTPGNWSTGFAPDIFSTATFSGMGLNPQSIGTVNLADATQSVAGVGFSNGPNTQYVLTTGTLDLAGSGPGALTQSGAGSNTIQSRIIGGTDARTWELNAGTLSLTNTNATAPNALTATTININAGATLRTHGTFTANGGGASGIAGATINLNGGTFVATGARTTTAGLEELRYAGTFGATRLNPISTGTGVLTLNPTSRSVLTGPLTFNQGQLDAKAGVADQYTIVWRGNVTVPAGGGTFSFGTESDDGSVLYIDTNQNNVFDPATELVVDNNGDHGTQIREGTRTLAAGTYPIAIGMYENGGGSIMTARVATGSGTPYANQTNINPGTSTAGLSFTFETTFTADFDYTTNGGGNLNVMGGVTSTLQVNTNSATFRDLLMGAGATLRVNQGTDVANGTGIFNNLTGSGTITIEANTPAILNGTIIGPTAINKTGTSVLTLNGASSTFTAPINVNAGILAVGAPTSVALPNEGALGSPTVGTTVNSGGQLALRYTGSYLTAEPVTINGTGPSGTGAIESATLNRLFAGPITLGSTASIVSTSISQVLTLTGGINTAAGGREVQFGTATGVGDVAIGDGTSTAGISGAGQVRKIGGGTLIYAANANNTYTGPTNIDGGALRLNNPNGLVSTSAVNINNFNTVLNVNATGANLAKVNATNAGAILRYAQDQAVGFVAGNLPTANFTGVLEIAANQGAAYDGFRLANGSTIRAATGPERTFAGDLLIGGSVNFGADEGQPIVISGVVANNGATVGNFVKLNGTDTVTLAGVNTYTGTSSVAGGVVNVTAARGFGATTGGAVTVSGGTVNASAANSLEGKTVNVTGGTVVLNQTAPAASAGAAAFNVNTGGVLRVATGGAGLGAAAITVGNGPIANPGTLLFDQGAGNTATYAGTTVNLNAGTINARTGVADLGTARINSTASAVTTFNNQLRAVAITTSSDTDPSTGANVNAILAKNANFTTTLPNGNKATLDFPTATGDASFNAYFGTTLADAFTVYFTGKFTAPVSGSYNFRRTDNDDTASVAVDVNNNGSFADAGDLIATAACCNNDASFDVNLTAGQVVGVFWGARDTGGGSGLRGLFTEPAGGTFTSSTIVQPGAQPGRFFFQTGTGGGTVQVDPGAELRAGSFGNVTSIAMTGTGSPAIFRLANNTAATASDATALSLLGTNPTGTFDTGGTGNTITIQNLTVTTGGTLTVAGAGRLLINGAPGAGTGAVNVTGTATLGGSGSIAGPVNVASGGTIAPGTSPGILSTGTVSFSSGSTFNVELNGLVAGTGYDQLNVTGGVNLGNADLVVSVGFLPEIGNQFTIISNDGTDLPTGVFLDGATVTSGPYTFSINYAGGSSNNDVVLTTIAVPEPASAGLLGLAAAGLLARRRQRRRRA